MSDRHTRLMNAVFEFRRALKGAGVDITGMSVQLSTDEAVFMLDDFLRRESPPASITAAYLTDADNTRVEICGIPFTARKERRRF